MRIKAGLMLMLSGLRMCLGIEKAGGKNASTPKMDAAEPRLELVETFERSFRGLVASGNIERMIDDALSKLVSELLKDSIKSYSDFGKSIESKIKTALAVGDMTLPQYGERVMQVIKTLVEGNIETSFQRALAGRLEKLLIGAPAEISLSKLCEQFAETIDNTEHYGQQWTLHFSQSFPDTSCLHDHWHLSLDSKPGVKERDCEYRIDLKKLKQPDGESDRYEPNGLQFHGRNVEKSIFVGGDYGFAATLWQLYAARTVVVFDDYPDDIDTSIGSD